MEDDSSSKPNSLSPISAPPVASGAWSDSATMLKVLGLAIATIGQVAIAISSIADKARPPLFWLSAATIVAFITAGALIFGEKGLRKGLAGVLAGSVSMLIVGLWLFVYRDHVRYASSTPWAP